MLKGSLVALVTPFDAHNRVDYAALKRLIEFHVNAGSNGLVIAGTTGEAATLTRNEQVDLISRVVELVDGRLPVVAGTGSNSTAQTIGLSRAVADSGIDAYLVVVPYYNKPTQEGIYQHFSAIADAVSKPVMLYNVPGRTVADMQPATVARAATHGNIFGIKEATGDIDRLKSIQDLVSDDFMLYSGDDFTVLQFLEQGGHGVVTVSGNVVPAAMSGLTKSSIPGCPRRFSSTSTKRVPRAATACTAGTRIGTLAARLRQKKHSVRHTPSTLQKRRVESSSHGSFTKIELGAALCSLA